MKCSLCKKREISYKQLNFIREKHTHNKYSQMNPAVDAFMDTAKKWPRELMALRAQINIQLYFNVLLIQLSR